MDRKVKSINIVVALTCYNRVSKTIHCVETLSNGNPNTNFTFVVVDDNSTDNTVAQLRSLNEKIVLIETEGNLFYSRGMKRGLDRILKTDSLLKNDFVLLVNDDVDFYSKAIEKIVEQSGKRDVIVGATCTAEGKQSYGAVIFPQKGKITAKKVAAGQETKADTFNANCVLIPMTVFKEVGSFDEHYIHGLGDYDYGLMISKKGYSIYSSREFVGICENNSKDNTWQDTKLSAKIRLQKKESVKGSPARIWWYYLKKHFGFLQAVRYSISPYVRIILRR